MRERLAMLISGGGTTMEAIIKACQDGEIPMDVSCVVTSDPNAGGVKKASDLGIDVITDEELLGKLKRRRVSVVTLNGYVRKVSEEVINAYSKSIYNQHPAWVPEFGGNGMYGRRVHAAVLLFTRMTNMNDPYTEPVAQRVHKEFDMGAVVGSERVSILPDDTVEDLRKRVLPVEHRLQIELLKQVAAGKVTEVPQRESLVKPGQEETLKLAKRVARLLYPRG